MIGFSIGFVDDLWSDWCYVVLLLMLDDLDVLSLIWLGFDLLFFFFVGFVEDLWFDDVICGFWVDDWVFYRIC